MYTSVLLAAALAGLAVSSPIAEAKRTTSTDTGFAINDFVYTITNTANWTFLVSDSYNAPPYQPSFPQTRCTGYSGPGFIASSCDGFNDNATETGSSRDVFGYVDSSGKLVIRYAVSVPTSFGHVNTYYYEGNRTVGAQNGQYPAPSDFIIPITYQYSSGR